MPLACPRLDEWFCGRLTHLGKPISRDKAKESLLNGTDVWRSALAGLSLKLFARGHRERILDTDFDNAICLTCGCIDIELSGADTHSIVLWARHTPIPSSRQFSDGRTDGQRISNDARSKWTVELAE